MKKKYQRPETLLINIKAEQGFLAGSPDLENVNIINETLDCEGDDGSSQQIDGWKFL